MMYFFKTKHITFNGHSPIGDFGTQPTTTRENIPQLVKPTLFSGYCNAPSGAKSLWCAKYHAALHACLYQWPTLKYAVSSKLLTQHLVPVLAIRGRRCGISNFCSLSRWANCRLLGRSNRDHNILWFKTKRLHSVNPCLLQAVHIPLCSRCAVHCKCARYVCSQKVWCI